MNKAKGIASLLFLLALIALPLVAIYCAADQERASREHILANGELAYAKVTRSFNNGPRRCAFKYELIIAGQIYEGGEGGCPLAKDHPVGSMVEVRFLASNPHESIAIGSSLWPGWVIVPFLIAVPILFLAGAIAASIMTGDGRRAQKSRRANFLRR